MEEENYNVKKNVIDGQVPVVPINCKIVFCDISGNP